MTAAQAIAEWSMGLTLDDIPEEVVEHAKLHLLDRTQAAVLAWQQGMVNNTGNKLRFFK